MHIETKFNVGDNVFAITAAKIPTVRLCEVHRITVEVTAKGDTCHVAYHMAGGNDFREKDLFVTPTEAFNEIHNRNDEVAQ